MNDKASSAKIGEMEQFSQGQAVEVIVGSPSPIFRHFESEVPAEAWQRHGHGGRPPMPAFRIRASGWNQCARCERMTGEKKHRSPVLSNGMGSSSILRC